MPAYETLTHNLCDGMSVAGEGDIIDARASGLAMGRDEVVPGRDEFIAKSSRPLRATANVRSRRPQADMDRIEIPKRSEPLT
jgi:hypothetical protein